MSLLIYLISFLEWFTTLSIEIVALRNFTPIIGTNSISTSIILWVILLALSYWYFIGWKKSKKLKKEEIKNKVILNLSIAWFYYVFFTFIVDKLVLVNLLEYTRSYFIAILLSSLILFFIPVFLASQTIPLLSEILKWDNVWEKMWKLLFFSTVWSFMWSVVTSIVLFPSIWVEKTAIFNSFILSLIALILASSWFKKINFPIIISIIVFLFSSLLLSSQWYQSKNIIYKEANSYHNIQVVENEKNQRILLQNHWYASGINIDSWESYFKYIKEIKSRILDNNYNNILVIWAAGFTLPNELSEYDSINKIDVVDVDKNLKSIAETYFLQKNLSDKIIFYSQPSRYFIKNKISKKKKYDAVVIDIYVWKSLPPQTLTYEFFTSLSNISDDIYINIITDKKLKSDFSKKLLSTLDKAFWEIYFKDVNQWKNSSNKSNFVISNISSSWYTRYLNLSWKDIYYDNKNSIEVDLFNQ